MTSDQDGSTLIEACQPVCFARGHPDWPQMSRSPDLRRAGLGKCTVVVEAAKVRVIHDPVHRPADALQRCRHLELTPIG